MVQSMFIGSAGADSFHQSGRVVEAAAGVFGDIRRFDNSLTIIADVEPVAEFTVSGPLDGRFSLKPGETVDVSRICPIPGQWI